MADPTANGVTIALHIQSLIEAQRNALDLADIFYGDQEKIARTPTVCVEAGEKRAELRGAPRRADTRIVTYVLVYAGAVRSISDNRVQADQLSEDLSDVIHAQEDLDGRVITSMVTAIDYGYQYRNNTLYRVSRMTIESQQYVQLPHSI